MITMKLYCLINNKVNFYLMNACDSLISVSSVTKIFRMLINPPTFIVLSITVDTCWVCGWTCIIRRQLTLVVVAYLFVLLGVRRQKKNCTLEDWKTFYVLKRDTTRREHLSKIRKIFNYRSFTLKEYCEEVA
jgi:hypothetical protein